jgi:hypothetical protein
VRDDMPLWDEVLYLPFPPSGAVWSSHRHSSPSLVVLKFCRLKGNTWPNRGFGGDQSD